MEIISHESRQSSSQSLIPPLNIQNLRGILKTYPEVFLNTPVMLTHLANLVDSCGEGLPLNMHLEAEFKKLWATIIGKSRQDLREYLVKIFKSDIIEFTLFPDLLRKFADILR